MTIRRLPNPPRPLQVLPQILQFDLPSCRSIPAQGQSHPLVVPLFALSFFHHNVEDRVAAFVDIAGELVFRGWVEDGVHGLSGDGVGVVRWEGSGGDDAGGPEVGAEAAWGYL